MRKMSKREIIILIICLLTVMVFGVVQLVVKPLREDEADLKQRLGNARRELARARATVGRASAVEAEYKRLAQEIGVASAEGKEASMMMSSFESAANMSGVHIINMQPVGSSGRGRVQVFSVEIVFDGTWGAVNQFLDLVQARPHFFKIEELNLEKSSDDNTPLRGRVVFMAERVPG